MWLKWGVQTGPVLFRSCICRLCILCRALKRTERQNLSSVVNRSVCWCHGVCPHLQTPPFFPFRTPSHFSNHRGSAPFIFRPVFASRPEPASREGLAHQISREEQEPERPFPLVAIQGDFKRDNHGRRNGKREGWGWGGGGDCTDADRRHAVIQC